MLVVVSLIPLIACVALAIDLGMLLAARTQVMDAADAAAMAGCRALNGNTTNGANNNYSGALPAAQQAATANSMLSTQITASQVSVNIGRYTYNSSAQRFEGQFPGPSTDNWDLVQATVNVPVTNVMSFAKIFNFSAPNIQAVATAVHRPRDIAIVLDYSGSMRFSSLMGTPYYGTRASNNPDSLYPVFGGYSDTADAALQNTTFVAPYSDANITTTTSDGRKPIVQDFYSDANGTAAWTAAPASYASVAGGDDYLHTNKDSSTTYAQNVAQVLNLNSANSKTKDNNWESMGYTSYNMNALTFYGYTTGPGYYGKTFWIWPPDPGSYSGPLIGVNDWRKRYFYYYGTATACDDNSRLYDSSGNWKAPGTGNYSINYAAILDFIKNIGPNPFPSSLRSGRIVYYTSIPSSITTTSWPPSDLNERFWKDYIDYVLGVIQDSTGYSVITPYTGYGDDYAWGTPVITAKSQTGSNYMSYLDNPKRPKLHFWFGPATMIDFLGNYNMWYHNQVNPDASRFCWWPGTCHESPMYACKLGIRAALTDISNNHPNDNVSLIMFSTPRTAANDTSASRFNNARVGLGRDYSSMQDSLWYPPSTIGSSTATVTPYDSNNLEVPRAMGGTCYAMALMQAFNQFSGASALANYNTGNLSGLAGGNGRKGAQKIIIFETDGAPNTTAYATLNGGGAYNSFYAIRYNNTTGNGEFPSQVWGYADNDPTVTSQIYSILNQICALDSAASPGYSTSTKKVLVHCIGFGPVFDPSSSTAATATATLNQMQTIGNVTDGMPSYKIIYGSESTVISNLQKAFTKILQDGVQVSLIQ